MRKKEHQKRERRSYSKIYGTSQRPRFSVFRSNKYIYAQLINDEKGQTILGVNEKNLKTKKKGKEVPTKSSKIKNTLKTEQAKLVGELLAQKALKTGIKKVVFDRGPFKYHGRIKALAEAARKQGLKF